MKNTKEMEGDDNMISTETFEQIESYILGRMDDEARLQFEALIKADTELAAEVELQQQLLAVIETSFFITDRQDVKIIRNNRKYFYWYAAAAVLLLFCAISFWLIKQQDNNTESLYAAYYEADAGLPVEMGAPDSTEYLFYDGMISYKEGDYTAALKKWEVLKHVGLPKDTLQYYIGMAYLNNRNTDKAISELRDLSEKTDAAYNRQAKWYLALAYLKKNEKEKAKKILMGIKDYPGALALLAKLK